MTVALLASARVAEGLATHPNPDLAVRLANVLKAAAGVQDLSPAEQTLVEERLAAMHTPAPEELERLLRN